MEFLPIIFIFLMGLAFATSMSEDLNKISTFFNENSGQNLQICPCNSDDAWDSAFDFSEDTKFISECDRPTQGGLGKRLCTSAELKLYGQMLGQLAEGRGRTSGRYLESNQNCNLTSWMSGCEAVWACAIAEDYEVDLKNGEDIPHRAFNCRPCCEGFFCPRGLSCMIPCPLGSFCPAAKLDKTTSLCEPYRYQIPPGKPNHTCGGANMWSDFTTSTEMFCEAGYYCPTPIEKNSLQYYCKAGSTVQTRCHHLAKCEANSSKQDMSTCGTIFMVLIASVLSVMYCCGCGAPIDRWKRTSKLSRSISSIWKSSQGHERWKSTESFSHIPKLSLIFPRKKSVRHDSPNVSYKPLIMSDVPLEQIDHGESSKDSSDRIGSRPRLELTFCDLARLH